MLSKSYEDVAKTLDKCGVIQNRYVRDGSTYAMPMETGSCVLGRRQESLDKQKNREWVNAYHYYGYWQLNGFVGSQKYRYYNNLEAVFWGFNPFMTEYSE